MTHQPESVSPKLERFPRSVISRSTSSWMVMNQGYPRAALCLPPGRYKTATVGFREPPVAFVQGRDESGRALGTVGPTGVAVQDALRLHHDRPSVSKAIRAQSPSVAKRIRRFHHQTAGPTQHVEPLRHDRLLPVMARLEAPSGVRRKGRGPLGDGLRGPRPRLARALGPRLVGSGSVSRSRYAGRYPLVHSVPWAWKPQGAPGAL